MAQHVDRNGQSRSERSGHVRGNAGDRTREVGSIGIAINTGRAGGGGRERPRSTADAEPGSLAPGQPCGPNFRAPGTFLSAANSDSGIRTGRGSRSDYTSSANTGGAGSAIRRSTRRHQCDWQRQGETGVSERRGAGETDSSSPRFGLSLTASWNRRGRLKQTGMD